MNQAQEAHHNVEKLHFRNEFPMLQALQNELKKMSRNSLTVIYLLLITVVVRCQPFI